MATCSKELGWLYARYLSAWLCIVTVDYIMEVRLEFAWPFILLLRSVKDTYTYKGLVSVGVLEQSHHICVRVEHTFCTFSVNCMMNFSLGIKYTC